MRNCTSRNTPTINKASLDGGDADPNNEEKKDDDDEEEEEENGLFHRLL